ncbi:DNA-processing protein DprA [Virgibacillus byunsanensis]|uniref:DNA-processing protein DprA n=1 Tax=Virgibacillus byunsanensis TaxID=570945 RepID=A0ABW3LKG0_9BACI
MLQKIFHYDPSLKTIYKLSSSQISHTFFIPQKYATLLYVDLRDPAIKSHIKNDLKNYTVITIVDEGYPSVLKTINDPPLVLYAYGDVSLVTRSPALSVIGTRNPSHEAKAKLIHIMAPLIQEGWVVVSGMAKGVDSYAHQLSLKQKGKTIAVLGGGFHHIYPKQNMELFKQIVQEGLVLSEYPPDTQPKKFHFPERNRIISGLSFGTLVIEATEKSGTLITVDQALDQGREVYAVPGSPLLPQTSGCNRMIQDGAKLVQVAKDIKEDWDRGLTTWGFIPTKRKENISD